MKDSILASQSVGYVFRLRLETLVPIDDTKLMMPKSLVEVIVHMGDNSGSSKGLEDRNIQVRRITSVVPTAGPPMIKLDD